MIPLAGAVSIRNRSKTTLSDNRGKILRMLSVGQITADEAERPIAALEKEQPVRPPGGQF